MEFDPRPWNLLAGLAVATGCSGRVVAAEAGSADATDEADTQEYECENSYDCPTNYYCWDGFCHYSTSPDGYIPDDDGYDDGDPFYDCYSDEDCGPLELCAVSCYSVGTPSVCNIPPPQPIPVEISDPVLALAFADIDDDGAEELVVATSAQLHVIESDSPFPISHPRSVESISIDGMVSGNFGPTPGHDLVLLHDDMLEVHHSDGVGNFDAPVLSPSPYSLARGLRAGAFDDQANTDLLVWGQASAGVVHDGGVFDLLEGEITSASAREYGEVHSGFTLLRGNMLYVFDLGGADLGAMGLYGEAPYLQTSMDRDGAPTELGSSMIVSNLGTAWTLVTMVDSMTRLQVERFGLFDTLIQMRAGNLGGLGLTDDLAMVSDDGTLRLLTSSECMIEFEFDGQVVDVAFGDHDGDGDDELAMHWVAEGNYVSVVDVE